MGKVKIKKESFNVDGVEIPTVKGLKQYLKSHELLQHCTTDKLNNENGTGKLVWARNPGSVFWPALIATLFDKPGYDPDANEPDILTKNDYRCIMFLETTFRYSVLGWKDLVLVDENRIDEQSCLIAKYNRFLRKSWRSDKSYKDAVGMLLQFKDIPVLQRQDRAFQLSLERKLIKAEKAVKPPKPVMENESSNDKRDNPLKYWEQRSAEDREYLGRQLGPNAFSISRRSECPGRAKETADNSTGDECSRSSSDSGDNGFKPDRSLPTSRSDTPNASSLSGGSEVETLSDISRRAKKRPKVGGAPMKTFTEERFISVDKGYKFDLKIKKEVWRCASCLNDIVTGQHVMCHELPHHRDCLLETDSISKDGSVSRVYKCHMCKEGQCFLCKLVTKELPSELEQATKCSKCDLRFHRSCLQAWPQAELQGSVGSIICPVHFCHTCLGEQKVYNRMRNYKAFSGSGGGKYRCLQCLTAYHKPCCLPAGTGDDITGKDFITCPKHTIPKIKTTQRRFGCLSCGIYMKANSTNRVECSLCLQLFHPECVGYTDIEANLGLKLSDFAKDYKCMSCLWGLHPLYGQVVWYQQTGHSFWPARILYPREAIGRTEYVQNRSTGEYSVKYFGPQPSYYDKASRTFPLHLTTVKLFTAMKIYKETDKIKSAYEEATFFHQHVEDLRDTRLMAPEPYYKKIERNIYRIPVNGTKKKQESIGSCCCNCYKSNGDVCTSNSGCHNRDTSVECNEKNCRAGYRCENRMFTQKLKDTENTEQFLSPSKGWAVKAARDFKEGEFIIEYCGEIINNVEMQYRANRKSEEDPLYLLEIDKNTFIDAEYYGNVSRLINHSCEPNCRTEKYTSVNRSVVGVFAHRDIDKGEELTFDYAYGDQSAAPFRCYCGTPTCRTYIGKSFSGDKKGDVVNFDLEKYDKTCAKCSFGGYVLCCDFEGCYKVYHKTCAQITREPENEWYCPNHSKVELKTAAKQKTVKAPGSPGSKLIYKSSPQQTSEVKGTAEVMSTSTSIQKRSKSDKFVKSRKIVSLAKNPLARRSLPAKIGGVSVVALAGKKKKDNENGIEVDKSRSGGEIKAMVKIASKRSSTSAAPSTSKNTMSLSSPSYQNNTSIPDLINIWTGTASSNLKNIMPVSSPAKLINTVTPRSKLRNITSVISPPKNSSFTKSSSKSAHAAKNAVKTVERTAKTISNVSNDMKRRSSRMNSTPPIEIRIASTKRSSKQTTNADEGPTSKRSCSRRRLSTPSSKENFSVVSESRSEETTKESPSNGSVGNEKVTEWLTKSGSKSQKSSDDGMV